MAEPDPVALAVESALTPSLAEAAAEVGAWALATAERATGGWDFIAFGLAPSFPVLRLRSLRVLVEHAYDETRPAIDLAWARDQAEQVAVKYEQFADREPNPLIKTCMEFAARIVRAEFLGQDSGGVNGRFTESGMETQ